MKKLILSIVITISPILAQCNWNDDDQIDVLDVVSTVECILTYCWDGSQCDWNGDGDLNVIDVVSTANCYLNDCWEVDTVTDIDGNSYETVQIGDQLWMAENLKVTHYQNGEDIPTGFSGSEWGDLEYTETGAFAVYNDDPANIETFGNLYNWYV